MTLGVSLNLISTPYVAADNRNLSRRMARARDCMDAGIAKYQGEILRVMHLTTSEQGDKSLLTEHFEALKKRIKRNFLSHFDYVKVNTDEGNGVIHCIYHGIFIPQQWLSRIWQEIHGSPIVFIQKMYFGKGLRNYLNPYLQGQGRLSYSHNWFYRGWVTEWTNKMKRARLFEMLKNHVTTNTPRFCINAFNYRFYTIVKYKLFKEFLAYAHDNLYKPVIKEAVVEEVPLMRFRQGIDNIFRLTLPIRGIMNRV